MVGKVGTCKLVFIDMQHECILHSDFYTCREHSQSCVVYRHICPTSKVTAHQTSAMS